MRKELFIANWKMFKTVGETVKTLNDLKSCLAGVSGPVVAVAPPFTSLMAAAEVLKGSNIRLACQNVYHEDKGAFTGEISPVMLKDLKTEYVIVGHSERRQYFSETDETVSKKVLRVMGHGMIPVVCIGETKVQRDSGKTFEILEKQLKGSLHGVELGDSAGLVIAYEPVWAIGTGDTATPEIAQKAHEFIRGVLAAIYKKSLADGVIILYGGSVKPDNTAALMAKKDINGALVGGASLEAASFAKIVKYS